MTKDEIVEALEALVDEALDGGDVEVHIYWLADKLFTNQDLDALRAYNKRLLQVNSVCAERLLVADVLGL